MERSQIVSMNQFKSNTHPSSQQMIKKSEYKIHQIDADQQGYLFTISIFSALILNTLLSNFLLYKVFSKCLIAKRMSTIVFRNQTIKCNSVKIKSKVLQNIIVKYFKIKIGVPSPRNLTFRTYVKDYLYEKTSITLP